MSEENETFLEKLLSYPLGILHSIEYYFAKRWLDKTFGEQEYWGDYLSDLIYQPTPPEEEGE